MSRKRTVFRTSTARGTSVMKSISYTQLRTSLAKTMDQICDDHTPIAITRNGAVTVVMMSLEDYEAHAETRYLLRSEKNAGRIMAALADAVAGNVTERELIECD